LDQTLVVQHCSAIAGIIERNLKILAHILEAAFVSTVSSRNLYKNADSFTVRLLRVEF
jgi:hypothetical protein